MYVFECTAVISVLTPASMSTTICCAASVEDVVTDYTVGNDI